MRLLSEPCEPGRKRLAKAKEYGLVWTKQQKATAHRLHAEVLSHPERYRFIDTERGGILLPQEDGPKVSPYQFPVTKFLWFVLTCLDPYAQDITDPMKPVSTKERPLIDLLPYTRGEATRERAFFRGRCDPSVECRSARKLAAAIARGGGSI